MSRRGATSGGCEMGPGTWDLDLGAMIWEGSWVGGALR